MLDGGCINSEEDDISFDNVAVVAIEVVTVVAVVLNDDDGEYVMGNPASMSYLNTSQTRKVGTYIEELLHTTHIRFILIH